MNPKLLYHYSFIFCLTKGIITLFGYGINHAQHTVEVIRGITLNSVSFVNDS